MSLEQSLNENTAALRELIALWKAGTVPAPAATPSDAPVKVVLPPAQAVATSSPAAAAPAASEPAKVEITYEVIKAKIVRLAAERGRGQSLAVLQRLGVTKGPDIKPEQYVKANGLLDEALAGADMTASSEVV